MDLQTLVHRYADRFRARYGDSLTHDQWSALNAIAGCRQGQYGELLLHCHACPYTGDVPRSCGHRACNQCQYHSTQDWLERQRQKQLPVNYYLVTFTLPYELRSLAKAHPKAVYNLLIQCAASTLKTFGLNKAGFEAELACVRCCTPTPGAWIITPMCTSWCRLGGIHRARREWRKLRGDYLFNGRALAAAFRGALLKALENAGLRPGRTPEKWIVHCEKVGQGEQALAYLARYLYRGVIGNRQLLEDDGTHITFRYRDSKTRQWHTRRETGEDFIRLVLQHVLPKGFRRARDYGFLHGNAKSILKLVHWVLRVVIPDKTQRRKAAFHCPRCREPMTVWGVRRPSG